MSISIGLQVRQSQSLAITPQLLQSIRLLQYDHHDLRDFLAREAERNPLIRIVERARGLPPLPASRTPRHGDGPATMADAAPSLAAHALGEIADALPQAFDRRLAEALLADLDEAGYLPVDAREAARRLGAPAARIEALLTTLRASAEPAGLFAANLAQCLGLQLERAGRLDPAFRALLSRLDLVARCDLAALSRVTRRDPGEVARMIAALRRLDPKPGDRFEHTGPQGVEPDVLITPEENGAWRVSLNARTMPRVLMDESYERTLLGTRSHGEGQAFLGECRASFGWLARALDQRARSILKVSCEIARRQEGFLVAGSHGLKPMTLAEVAQAVGLHESTVSRVCANKYLATPRGTFELRFFFSSALADREGGAAHASTGVRARIKRLVEAERFDSVLSDEDIAAALGREGIDIARRTVAKYREALGIASSARRRREMNLARLAS